MPDSALDRAKQEIRERVWALMEREGAAPPGVRGHIPDFVGAEAAAARLAELDVWRRARVIMANPDRAQLPVRVRALQEGKLVYMAVPRLEGPKPFYRLDPAALTIDFAEAATGTGAAKVAPLVDTTEMEPVDLIVCGSVAVNRQGARLGKGAGYSDTEVAMLTSVNLTNSETTIATTVHSIQVLNDSLPESERDFRVTLIASPIDAYSIDENAGHPRKRHHWQTEP